MNEQERAAILKAGRTHEHYDKAIRDLLYDVRALITANEDGLGDWLYEGDYRDMPTVTAQDIAAEWDSSTGE